MLEIFGCVLEALNVGKGVFLSLPLNMQNCSRGAGIRDLLNAQRRERRLCSSLTLDFWMNWLHSQKCAVFL